MCTKDRNVYIKFVRVSNNLYYYARYLLRLWCSRMRHGGMVSRGRWDMRWWWFSLTDILIHIIHVIHTYVHTLGWGGEIPQLHRHSFVFFFFFFFFFNIHIHMLIYIYMHIYTHIYIYTHTWTYRTYPRDHAHSGEGEIPQLHRLHTTQHTWVRGRYPGCTHCTFFLNFAHSGEGEIPQIDWHNQMHNSTSKSSESVQG